jgi:hypothetical protein
MNVVFLCEFEQQICGFEQQMCKRGAETCHSRQEHRCEENV